MNIELIGLAAGLLTATQQVPQVVRTARTGETRGIAVGMWAILLAQAGAWIGYGAREDLIAAVLTNFVIGACAGTMMWLLARHGVPGVRRAMMWVVGAVVIQMVVFLTLPNWALGAVAAALAFAVLLPQVRVALTTTDLSGLSRTSWVLGVINTTMWVIYGVGSGATLLWLSAGQALVWSVVVLGRLTMLSRVGLVTYEPTD